MDHYYSSSSTSGGISRLLNVLAVLLHAQTNLAVPVSRSLPEPQSDIVKSSTDMLDLSSPADGLQENSEQTTRIDTVSASSLGDTSLPPVSLVLKYVFMDAQASMDTAEISPLAFTATYALHLSDTSIPASPTSMSQSMPSATPAPLASPAVFSGIYLAPGLAFDPTDSTASNVDETGFPSSTSADLLPTTTTTPFSPAVASVKALSQPTGSAYPPLSTDGGDGDFAAASTPSNHGRTPLIIGCVLLGLLAFSLGTCLLVYVKRIRNVLFGGVHRNVDSFIAKDLEKSSPAESQESKPASPGRSLPMLRPWIKLPSQISPFTPRDSLLSFFSPSLSSIGSTQARPTHTSQTQTRNNTRLKNKVIDIVPDFPRSRFSVTSSDYTHSVHAIDPDSEDEGDYAVESLENVPSREVPLLTPAEFFSMPTSTTLASKKSVVSKRSSAPVFGRHRREVEVSVALSRAGTVKTLDSARDSVLLTRGRSRSKSTSVSSSRMSLRRTKSIG